MSLEHIIHNNEVTSINGVYCLFYFGNQLILVSNPPSDLIPKGKAEGDYSIDDHLTPLTLDQLSVVSGGAKSDDLSSEMVREIEEETGLKVDPKKLFPLVQSPTRTIQSRNGKGIYDISGIGFRYDLNSEELRKLVDYLILHDRNMAFGTINELAKNDNLNLRPFAHGVLHEMNQLEVA